MKSSPHSQQPGVLVIALTGFANKLNLPVEEFFEKAGLLGVSRIVVSDPSKRMTLGGMPPENPTFADFVSSLRGAIAREAPTRLIVTGTSGGGHTALLLGHLLKAHEVVAFSPYPYLSVKELKRRQDPALESMSRVLGRLHELPDAVKVFFDLREVLCRGNGTTHYHVHVSRHHEWDYRRAMYLANLPQVSVIPHSHSAHSIAAALARHGKLGKCFEFPYVRESPLTQQLDHLRYRGRQLAGKLFRSHLAC